MLSATPHLIYLAREPIDMRKSIDGLSLLVSGEFGENPASGSGYVFYNRGKNKVKLLYFDRTGFVLFYKRLERGQFIFLDSKERLCAISLLELQALLAGADIKKLKIPRRLEYGAS
jgi:transposase